MKDDVLGLTRQCSVTAQQDVIQQCISIFLPLALTSPLRIGLALHGIQILDGVQACKSGSKRQIAQHIVVSLTFKISDSIFPFLSFHFFFCSVSFLHFLRCCGKTRYHQFVSGGDLIVAILKKKKIQAKDLLQCE